MIRRENRANPTWAQIRAIREDRVEQNYGSTGTKFGQAMHDIPDRGVQHAEQYKHTDGDPSRPYAPAAPKILAGYSIGGDAALRARGPEGGGKWNYRIVTGCRTDGDFVDRLVAAANNSERVVYVGIRGDVNLQNDPIFRKALGGAAQQFGDRSFETAIHNIEQRFGSVQDFYKAHPNVALVATDGSHAGAAERPETHAAIGQGLDQVERQMPQSSQQAPQSTKPTP